MKTVNKVVNESVREYNAAMYQHTSQARDLYRREQKMQESNVEGLAYLTALYNRLLNTYAR